MHERTERAIAQLLFVFCCAVPTSITLFCILATWTPWYRAARLEELTDTLSTQTGLVVEVDSYQRVSPIHWCLNGVSLFEPETRQLVATVRRIDWVHTQESDRIVLHQSELQGGQINHAWRLLHDRLLSRPEHTHRHFEVDAAELTIRSTLGDVTLVEMESAIQPTSSGVRLSLSFVPVESAPASENSTELGPPVSRCQVTMVRDRSGPRPISTITLQSGGNELNCSALAEYVPLMRSLGPNATFHGTIEYQIRDTGWSVELDGSRFRHVDMNRLCENLPFPIRGTGEIQFDRGQIHPGQTLRASGTLQMRDGWLGNRLVESLGRRIGIQVAPQTFAHDGRDVHYDLIALRFAVNGPASMSLKGICSAESNYRWAGQSTAGCDAGRAIMVADVPSVSPARVITTIGADRRGWPMWAQVLMPLGDEPKSNELMPAAYQTVSESSSENPTGPGGQGVATADWSSSQNAVPPPRGPAPNGRPDSPSETLRSQSVTESALAPGTLVPGTLAPGGRTPPRGRVLSAGPIQGDDVIFQR